MTMKSSTVCLFSLTLVFLKVLSCEGCWKHEREALLGINDAYFGNRLPWADNIDCCKWDRVECNATTVRVSKLDLSTWEDYYDIRPWRLNYSHFLVFEDLKILNLSTNYMSGCVGKEGHSISYILYIPVLFFYGMKMYISVLVKFDA